MKRSAEICKVANEQPEKESVCVVIVTFQPDSGFSTRLERVTGQVAQAVIVDNGSVESCVAELRRLAERLPVHLILNPENEGIARALNQGVRWAAAQGYLWALTLDQDTVIAPDMVESLAEVYAACSVQADLAVIGIEFQEFCKWKAVR